MVGIFFLVVFRFKKSASNLNRLFSNEKGLTDLSQSAQFGRLFVVKMVRGQHYSSLEEVQAELSPKILELCSGESIRFLFFWIFLK
jgi:hypothetical protein